MRRYKVTVTTDGSGNATYYSPRLAGELVSIQYVKNGVTPFATGVDFAITTDGLGENLWTESNVDASAVRYPRAPTHTQAGVAALYAAGGAAVLSRIPLASDRIKIVVTSGGVTKTGDFYFFVQE